VTALVANLIGVLLAGALLGVAVWVVDVGVLAWLVSRPSVSRRAVAGGLAVVAAVTVTYVGVVILIGVVLTML
jgi:hypothetical protein